MSGFCGESWLEQLSIVLFTETEPRWSMATAAIHFQSAMEMMNNPSLCLPPRSTALVWRVPSKVLVGPILQPQNPALAPLQPHRFRFYGFFLFLFIFIFTLFVKANNPFRRHDLAQTGGKEKEKENCWIDLDKILVAYLYKLTMANVLPEQSALTLMYILFLSSSTCNFFTSTF